MKNFYLIVILLTFCGCHVVRAQSYPAINSYSIIPNPVIVNQSFKLVVSLTFPYSAIKTNKIQYLLNTTNKALGITACYQLGNLTVVSTIIDTIVIPPINVLGNFNFYFIAVTAADTACKNQLSSNNVSGTFDIAAATSINKSSFGEQNNFFYDPQSQSLVVREKMNFESLNLMDLNGKTVRNWSDPHQNQYSLEDLPAACYILQVTTQTGQHQRMKVFKN